MTHTIKQTQDLLSTAEAFKRIKPVLDAVHSVIAAEGARGVPSGHLYASVMGCMSFDTYQAMIRVMLRTGAVTLENNVLRATT